MEIIWKKSCFALFIALLLILLTQGCVAVRPEIDLSSTPVSADVAYGKAVNPFVLQRLGATIQDEDIQGYLTAVAGKLQVAAQGDTFFAVNDPVPAAFALPGGEIVVTRGLLYQIESETELLAVLAHLLGHDRARDGMKLAVWQETVSGEFVASSSYFAAAASSMFLTEPFSAAQELVADQHAAEIFRSAGFDPAEIPSLLSSVYARLAALPDLQSGSFLQQHPFSSKQNNSAPSLPSVASHSPAELSPVGLEPVTFDEFRSKLLATQSGFQQYQQALQLEKQGSADEAIGLYLQAAAAAPNEELLLTGLGLAYMRHEDLVAARQHLTRASRLNSRYYHPQLGLGYIYLQQNNFLQAEEHLRRSQTLLPTALGGYFQARLLEETADIPAAIAEYRDVVRYFKESQMGRLAEKRILELESSHGLE